MKKVLFKRRKTKDIPNVPIIDGQLVYDTETGATYMDVGDKRISTGGGDGGTSEELIKPTYYYGDLNYNNGNVIDTPAAYQKASRTTGNPIDCLNKGLKLKIPQVSANYKDTSQYVQIRFFAYDENNKYVGGVTPGGTILTPGQQPEWAKIPHGAEFTLKKGYKYKFVNNAASDANTFKNNDLALQWLENELEVYLTSAVDVPNNASELPANVPPGLPPGTLKNTQAILNALDAKPQDFIFDEKAIDNANHWKSIGLVKTGPSTKELPILGKYGVLLFYSDSTSIGTGVQFWYKITSVDEIVLWARSCYGYNRFSPWARVLSSNEFSIPTSSEEGSFLTVKNGKATWTKLDNAAEVGM